MSDALQSLIALARTQSTETVAASIRQLPYSESNSAEERMTRAALLEVFIEREGEEAGDRLMDEIGL